MTKRQPKRSPAYQLMAHVWESTNEEIGHSYERLNHAMHSALTLAIGAGMKFFPGDFSAINEDFRGGYWLGATSEWAYTLAVAVGNKSAIDAYEGYKNRGPFIADNVEPGSNYSHEGFLHLSGTRQRARLALGFKFPWRGETVNVTSMPRGDGPVIACSYKGNPSDYPSKILHRYKITREGIIEERRRMTLIEQLTLDAPEDQRAACLKMLGNPKDKAALEATPLKLVEKAAKAFLKTNSNAQ
jgi:hypothetical protein